MPKVLQSWVTTAYSNTAYYIEVPEVKFQLKKKDERKTPLFHDLCNFSSLNAIFRFSEYQIFKFLYHYGILPLYPNTEIDGILDYGYEYYVVHF